MTKHTVTRNTNYTRPYYIYRGVDFRIDQSVQPGYWGRYQVGKEMFTYRRDVLRYIDKIIEA